MKKLILTGLTCLITATSVFAKDFDWEQIAHTPDGFILYADNNFYEGQDFAWVIIKEPKHFKTPKSNFADSTMLKVYVNCEKNLMKMADTAYLKNNKVIETDNDVKENAYKKIRADTMFSVIADWYCSF
jgi:hypothetical protein